ncbi:tRNA delta(2)-isopentenylpyrophosphate transferase [Chlorobaculum parvum NCIB 8327]|uniref:tRNA dimethylallyltransferase n=1 Tax=Chlorobaculum parvum (strain DSM 263 / NCIMB 8327) TaxID=517417 RepID=MIAA_CHLP8|nr:tRNA (adenosine(37)-N6)-dimethylallyltransferase MiaA [Chlorobaculum parvum]B3QNZ0.1 RecName: Full=tRNA dimethylallyltransferase; AltName: Full=Dimethylallyl diphosphate:tRNA dimethylallyltransferase; Short=DMAPP:tRNA dimethylallyltransferase; Short=DMATase; AltName: Full=Isopentenyl-diphosphate:tRNA isopentenyltransferase; Short=IPP transferase; Short=IPPT; Short=IPTase [Chlorobaculum parvum NCIB 8327]ACF11643.1 tRNA delta(2)-isopentenylpyrophosphate transferase [Chlorobaculum parvum NCIB 832
MSQKPVLVILGPTASGKTELAFRIARKTGGEIISADSRQIYRSMDIGTAKPPKWMLNEVKHHFIDEKEIGEPFSAGDFAEQAAERIRELRQRGITPIVAGGSTLYLEGLLKGFAELPQSNPEIRARLKHELELHGAEALYRRLEAFDPEQAKTLDPTKTQRLIRSLEIIEISGTTVTALQRKTSGPPPGIEFTVIALDLPREVLYERINRRTSEMMHAGLEAETRHLFDKFRDEWRSKKLNALATVGYRELFEHFEGLYNLETAEALIAQHTRNYAKRQLTFFRNRLDVEWVKGPLDEAGIEALVESLCEKIA